MIDQKISLMVALTNFMEVPRGGWKCSRELIYIFMIVKLKKFEYKNNVLNQLIVIE